MFLTGKTIRRALTLAGLVTAGVVAIVWLAPQTFLCVDSGLVSADVIIVLGGGVRDRPARAAALFQQHAAPIIILTGAGDDLLNRRILREAGVPSSVIQIENQSQTTRQNALFTIRLLRAEHLRRAIIVTSWYHSRRALKCFQHYAPDLVFFSRPDYFALARADWQRTGTGRRMWLEFLKLPGYWIRYGINPF